MTPGRWVDLDHSAFRPLREFLLESFSGLTGAGVMEAGDS